MDGVALIKLEEESKMVFINMIEASLLLTFLVLSEDNDLFTSATIWDLERTFTNTRHSSHVVWEMEDGRTSVLAVLHLSESEVLLTWIHLIVTARNGLRWVQRRLDRAHHRGGEAWWDRRDRGESGGGREVLGGRS